MWGKLYPGEEGDLTVKNASAAPRLPRSRVEPIPGALGPRT
jgi:hypothetical protein